MKNLFFVAVAAGIFSGTITSVNAQVHLNPIRFANKVSTGFSPKFIEGITIIPERGFALPTVENEVAGTIITGVSVNPVASSEIRIEDCSDLQFKYAMLMERNVESISNFALYNFIDDWWGIRYRYGGSSRDGIDCSSFAGKLLAKVYGFILPRTAKELFHICDKLTTENLAEGDLVFFNTRGGVSHVGVYLGNNYFVHSSVHDGVTISSLSDPYYNKRYISGGRINNCN